MLISSTGLSALYTVLFRPGLVKTGIEGRGDYPDRGTLHTAPSPPLTIQHGRGEPFKCLPSGPHVEHSPTFTFSLSLSLFLFISPTWVDFKFHPTVEIFWKCWLCVMEKYLDKEKVCLNIDHFAFFTVVNISKIMHGLLWQVAKRAAKNSSSQIMWPAG